MTLRMDPSVCGMQLPVYCWEGYRGRVGGERGCWQGDRIIAGGKVQRTFSGGDSTFRYPWMTMRSKQSCKESAGWKTALRKVPSVAGPPILSRQLDHRPGGRWNRNLKYVRPVLSLALFGAWGYN